MSNVLRPNRNALAWLLSSVTNSPTAGSENGACQPPWVKVSLGSSSGPPGACITPSRVRNVWTVRFISVQTKRRTETERVSPLCELAVEHGPQEHDVDGEVDGEHPDDGTGECPVDRGVFAGSSDVCAEADGDEHHADPRRQRPGQ